MAIVPYTYANPFGELLKLDSRIVVIGDQSFTLQQRWRDDGKGGTGIGFGASVYNSSIVLAQYIDEMVLPTLPRRASVLELGAGLALGALAASAGARNAARRVIATDGDDMVVEYAQSVLDANGVAGRAVAARLLWGDAADMDAVWALLGHARPGVIVAADVVAAPYAAAIPALVDTLKRFMLPARSAGAVAAAAAATAGCAAGAAPTGVDAAALLSEAVGTVAAGPPSTACTAGVAKPAAAAGFAGSCTDGSAPAPSTAAVPPDTPAAADAAHGDATSLPPPLALPPTSCPRFLLAYQRRHFSEDAFFERMAEWCTVTEIPRHLLHRDFRTPLPGAQPIRLFCFTVKDDAAAAAAAAGPLRPAMGGSSASRAAE